MGHRIHSKTSPKAASEKAQTTVSKNRYTNPIVDVFRTVVLSLLASTRNSVRAPFLVHQVPCTFATVWRYRRVFTQFSLRVGVSDYTCRPMIAKLLYNTCIHCCKCWSAQAWKLLGNVHMCPSLCTSMYTAPVYKGWPSSSSSVQGVSKFVHMLCTNWTLAWAHVYISKQFPSLGTPTSTAVIPHDSQLCIGKYRAHA